MFDISKINLSGVIKSNPDPRDFLYSRIAAPIPLPSKFMLEMPKGFQFNNQGVRGTCTAQAAVVTQEFLQYKEFGVWEDLSAEFVYDVTKMIDGMPESEGSHMRFVAQVITKYGACKEAMLPYRQDPHPCVWPSQDLIKAAYPQRSLYYVRVQTEQEFKQALVQQKVPILFGIICCSNMAEMKDGIWPMPEGTFIGGHAMVVVGYDDEKRHYIVINSWGTGQPTDNGFVYISYDYMHGANDMFPWLMDAFTLVDFIDPNAYEIRKQNLINQIPDMLRPEKVLINVNVNNEPVDMAQYPSYLINSLTYVPLRFVSQKLGAVVNWKAISDNEHQIDILK